MTHILPVNLELSFGYNFIRLIEEFSLVFLLYKAVKAANSTRGETPIQINAPIPIKINPAIKTINSYFFKKSGFP